MTKVINDQRRNVADERDRTPAGGAGNCTNRARKRHENDTVLTWFLHGFFHPPEPQPRSAPTLAPPRKTYFRAPAPVLAFRSVSGAIAKRTQCPERLFMFHGSSFTSSTLRTHRDLPGTHPGPLFYAFLAPPPPQPMEASTLPRAAASSETRAFHPRPSAFSAHAASSICSISPILQNEPNPQSAIRIRTNEPTDPPRSRPSFHVPSLPSTSSFPLGQGTGFDAGRRRCRLAWIVLAKCPAPGGRPGFRVVMPQLQCLQRLNVRTVARLPSYIWRWCKPGEE